MSVGTSSGRIEGIGITGGDLTIYGQSAQSGTLSVVSSDGIITENNIAIHSGTVIVDANGEYSTAIVANGDKITSDGIYDIYFCPGGNSSWGYYYMYVQKVDNPTVSVTFAPEGFATYYNGQCDVTLPAGVKARVITDSGDKLTYLTIADGDDSSLHGYQPAARQRQRDHDHRRSEVLQADVQ